MFAVFDILHSRSYIVTLPSCGVIYLNLVYRDVLLDRRVTLVMRPPRPLT